MQKLQKLPANLNATRFCSFCIQVPRNRRFQTVPPLTKCSPDAAGIPWAEWKAAALNRLFQEHGTSGQPGRITAETVRHGERLARGQGLPPERS